MPLLFWKTVVNSKNNFENSNKAFHYLVELVEMNLLMYNTLHSDQYSRIAICLNIFITFWQIIRKRIQNLKKAFQKFVELVKTNPLMYNIKHLI